jgi:hypothetical protein
VARDYTEAWFWLMLARAQKPGPAGHYFQQLQGKVSPQQQETARRRAAAWTPHG